MRARAKFAGLLLALMVPGSALLGQKPAAAPHPASPQAAPAANASPKGARATAPLPAQPPEVTLRGGLLTIQADNSTFSDVLNAVQQATGASIEIPASSSERVYFRGGPGEPRDVLASLLNGSPYDYILLGSPQQPQAVTRIMLSLRKSASAQPATAAAATPARKLPPAKPEVDTTESDNSEPAIPIRQQPPPPPSPAAGTPAPPGVAPPGQTMPGQPLQPGQVRTPEQMLQELQRIQQQQQQQLQLQQQLNQQNGFSR